MVLPYKNEYGDELDYRFFYFPTFILILLVTLAMSILPYIYKNTHHKNFWKNKDKLQLDYIPYDESVYYMDGKKIIVIKYKTKKAYPVSSYNIFQYILIGFQI
jgi:hypothetical protein